MKGSVILGKYELAHFPDLGKEDVKAKVDTGAKSSALHASHIRVREKDGKERLECYLLGDHTKKVVFDTFSTRIIKSSNGSAEKRFVVALRVRVYKRAYKTEFTLSNRISMRFPVLLGRRFLRKKYLVDVSGAYLAAEKLGRQNPDKRYLHKAQEGK